MSFEIDIKVDPGQAIPAIKGVETALGKAEAAGPRAGASIGRGMREGASAAAGAQRAVSNLGAAFAQLGERFLGQALGGVGRAFAGLTAQLEREHAILERLHGPAREHAADIKALEMLYRKAEISAAEYHAEVARMNGAMAGSRGASVGGGLGAIAGKAASVMGAAYAAKSVLDLSDSYTNLENRLRQVAGSQGELNQLMERTKSIADSTRSDWASTGEAFVRLTNATKQLGVSQERALQITETLNMALQSSGASSTEAAAGTLQLMQALSSGALQGDEFRSIAEQLPFLLDLFAKQMGVSRGELKKLGSEGKITADVVVKSLEAAEGAIRDKFAASTATASQQWTVFKNQLVETAGEFVKNSQLIPLLGQALSSVSAIVGPLASALGSLIGVIAKVGGAVKDLGNVIGLDLNVGLGTFAGMIVGGPVGAALGTLAEGFLRASGAVFDDAKALLKNQEAREEALKAQIRQHFELTGIADQLDRTTRLLIDSNQAWATTADLIGLAALRMQALHKQLSGGGGAGGIANDLFGFGAKLNNMFGSLVDDNWGESYLEKWIKLLGWAKKPRASGKKRDPWEGWTDFRGFSDISPNLNQSLGKGANAFEEFQKEFADAMKENEKIDKASAEYRDKLNQMAREHTLHLDEIKQKWAEWAMTSDDTVARISVAFQQLNDGALANLRDSILSLGDAFADAMFEADFSWKKFFQSMAQDMARAGFRGLLQFGLDSAGFPGAATGGSWTVGGSGGTDSQIAMLRVTPREHITVSTPGQVETERASSGGSRRVVQEMPDGSRRTYVMEDDVEELVVRVVERQIPALRTRILGR